MFSLGNRWITCNGGYARWYRSPYGQTGCLIVLLEYPQHRDPLRFPSPVVLCVFLLFFFSSFYPTRVVPRHVWLFRIVSSQPLRGWLLSAYFLPHFHIPLALSARLLRKIGVTNSNGRMKVYSILAWRMFSIVSISVLSAAVECLWTQR